MSRIFPLAFVRNGDISLVEWLYDGNKVKEIFDQDELVYPFKDSYHEPGFSWLVQEVESQREIAISLNSEYTEVKGGLEMGSTHISRPPSY